MLKLSDVAGLPIGHVPRCLAGLFRTVLDEGGTIFAEATGDPIPSFPPWPAPKDEGGGVVIPANYLIIDSNVQTLFNKIMDLFDNIVEGSAMKLLIH